MNIGEANAVNDVLRALLGQPYAEHLDHDGQVSRLTQSATYLASQAHKALAAGLTAERLRPAMNIEGDDAGAVAKLFQLHPAFQPRTYIDLRVEVLDDERAVISFGESPAFDEGDPYSWLAQLDREPHPALDAIAQAANRRARCHPVTTSGAHLSWEMVIDPAVEPAPEAEEVRMAKGSNGAALVLAPRSRRRIPVAPA